MNEEARRIKDLIKKRVLTRSEGRSLLSAIGVPVTKKKLRNPFLWGWSLFALAALVAVYWAVFNREFSGPLPDLIEKIGLFPWGDG